MFLLKENSEIVLYGGQSKAEYEEFIGHYAARYRINAVYQDDLKLSADIMQIPVRSEIMLKETQDMIIVIGTGWKQACLKLQQQGFLPFCSFIPDWVLKFYFNTTVFSYGKLREASYTTQEIGEMLRFIGYEKKVALVYGNCQVPFLVRMLARSPLVNDYVLLSVPPVQSLGTEENENGLNRTILSCLQLFIYQVIKEKNKFSPKLSSDAVKKLLSKDCITLAIPNVFFKGYFPQHCHNPYNVLIGSRYNKEGLFPYGDKNIIEMQKKGYDAVRIAAELGRADYYGYQELADNAENSLKELRKREKDCDVVISDYISVNYRKTKLFYVPNHPVNQVLKVLAERILVRLKYEDTSIEIANIPENDNLEMPVYPAVKEKLGLQFEVDRIWYCRRFNAEPVTLTEYVSVYTGYCCPDKQSC